MKEVLFITHQTDRYTYLQSVELALAGGCRRIQLRMKEAPEAEVGRVGLEAKRLCDLHGAELYIDDHVAVARNIGATGVHLGKSDLPPTLARALLTPGQRIGGTANTLEDIAGLHAEGVDYIGLGPFRFTTTKRNLSPVLGLEGYREIIEACRKRQIDLPIIAIGGITRDDLSALMTVGVSGIALSSTVLTAADPVVEMQEIVHLVEFYQS